jgi:hypothetical protein
MMIANCYSKEAQVSMMANIAILMYILINVIHYIFMNKVFLQIKLEKFSLT